MVKTEGEQKRPIKSVAIIGAGASGAITAAALHAEQYFDRIRVFERRPTAGGTWIYDPNPDHALIPRPGALPTETDPQLPIPKLEDGRSVAKEPNTQQRFEKTPIYDQLTTNVPDIAMSFSDVPFAYGPFVPHWIPRQYIETFFSTHGTDKFLQLGTTVEDVSKLEDNEGWKITLRKHDAFRDVDEWWSERFDAVVVANGHYSVPYIPEVPGLDQYIKTFPGRIQHSKTYRRSSDFEARKIVVVGNSASGHDVTASLIASAALPVYQSRRSASRWDGKYPPEGIEWKPVISEYLPDGRIIFEDGSFLDDVDTVIYCTGYRISFPFWNAKTNGARIWDYAADRVLGNYLHTFLPSFPTVALVGVPRVLTFRGFEYQAVAIARVFAGRSKTWGNISGEEKKRWEDDRAELVTKEKRRFHDIRWEDGDTDKWLTQLFEIAGLGTLKGEGRLPPVLGDRVRWALENVKKYPEPEKDGEGDKKVGEGGSSDDEKAGWVVVGRSADDLAAEQKDLLSFI